MAGAARFAPLRASPSVSLRQWEYHCAQILHSVGEIEKLLRLALPEQMIRHRFDRHEGHIVPQAHLGDRAASISVSRGWNVSRMKIARSLRTANQSPVATRPSAALRPSAASSSNAPLRFPGGE